MKGRKLFSGIYRLSCVNMYSDSHSPSPSPSPSSQQKKKKRTTIPQEHKQMLHFLMFEDKGGALSTAYQRGLKKNGGNFKSNFWPHVTKKLNGAVKATYTQEVMKCRN